MLAEEQRCRVLKIELLDMTQDILLCDNTTQVTTPRIRTTTHNHIYTDVKVKVDQYLIHVLMPQLTAVFRELATVSVQA